MNQMAVLQETNPLDIFKFEGHDVRTTMVDDNPWFSANDVAGVLQYSEASAMTRHLDDDEKGLSNWQTLGGAQQMLVINESGLYSAILRSRKEEAKRFKKWVTSVLIPGIRKKEFVHVSAIPAQSVNMDFVMKELADLKALVLGIASKPVEALAALPAPVVQQEGLSKEDIRSLGLMSTIQVAKKINVSTSRMNAIFEVMGLQNRIANRRDLSVKGLKLSIKVGMVNTPRGAPREKYLWKPEVVAQIPRKYYA